MADLNLDLNFFDHPKCARLVGLLGRDSEVFPLRLWCYVGKYHSVDGQLLGYSPEAIEQIVRWRGQPGKCLEALTAVGFLDEIENGFKAHDWDEHQGHIHALKVRNKKVAKNRWKTIRRNAELPKSVEAETKSMCTSGTPKSTSGVPQPSIPTNQKRKEKEKPLPPDKPPAVSPPKPPPVNNDGAVLRPLTDVQRVVHGFKAVLGVSDDDVGWDKVYFPRYTKPAKDLLTLFEGNLDRVADCIDQVSAAMERKKLSWTPETLVKHAGDWKNGRLFK